MTRRALAVLFALVLAAAACAEEAPVAEDDGGDVGLAAATETTAAPPTTQAPPTTASMHDDEMGHDDEAAEHSDDEMGHDDEAASDFDREIEVLMTEFAFEPSTISVTAGETVRFVLVNEGLVPHEFRLTTAHAAAEHVASGHEGHTDEGTEGGHGHDEKLVEVAAGATDTLTVTFAEAAEFDQFACLIPGHYEAGMLGDLTLTG